MLLANEIRSLSFIGVLTGVIDAEFCTQEVASNLTEISRPLLANFFLVHADHIVRCLVSRSFLASEQKLVSLRQTQYVLGPEAIHAALVSRDGALDLTYSGRQRFHVHLLEFLDRGEWVEKLGDKGVIELFIVFGERSLWNDSWLIVGRCIVVLILVDLLFSFLWLLLLFLLLLLLAFHLGADALLDLCLLLLLSLLLLFHSSLLHLLLLKQALLLLLQ